jgi:hypothetical protein
LQLPSLSIRALAIQHSESGARIRGDGSHYSHCAPQGSSVWLSCRSTPVDLIRAGDPREWLDARPPLPLNVPRSRFTRSHRISSVEIADRYSFDVNACIA